MQIEHENDLVLHTGSEYGDVKSSVILFIIYPSPRQKDVAILAARGLSNKKIAEKLEIHQHTVASHIAMILKKVNAPSAPHFPTALGCSEFWGRWFFADEEPFERATEQDLEAAITVAGWPR